MSQHDKTMMNIQERNLRKFTMPELMSILSSFAREFQHFDPKIVITTPQADRGIGPVQYDIKLRANAKPSMAALRSLNKLIELEKFRGDQLIKLDASLLYVATGKEDPLGFLPPGCRVAIRTEIQRSTFETCQAQKLTHLKDVDREILHELISSTDDLKDPPNPAEIALLCDLAPKLDQHGAANGINIQHNDFSYEGIKNTITNRRKARSHIQRIRKVIHKQFTIGACETMAMSEDDESDDVADSEENWDPPLEEEDMARHMGSFYSPIFASLQQKNASVHLTTLWQRDPFKAKWTILARAYSAIRDKVGKPRAPLDRFFLIVCPQLGIISSEQYLEKMGWTIERDLDGVMKLTQTSAPDVASFEDHLKHTIMTENDVAHYCGQLGYITESAAAAILGPQYDPTNGAAAAASRQSLLATTPVTVAPASSTREVRATAFLERMVDDPLSAASEALGFDMRRLVGDVSANLGPQLPPNVPPNAPPYEWTGCMADLYNPNEGSFNFDFLANEYTTSAFDAGEISDPRSFEAMFGEVIQDGFLQLPTPDGHYNPRIGL